MDLEELSRVVLIAAAGLEGWFTSYDVHNAVESLTDVSHNTLYVSIPRYLRLWWAEGLLEREKAYRIRDELPSHRKQVHAQKLFYRWID